MPYEAFRRYIGVRQQRLKRSASEVNRGDICDLVRPVRHDGLRDIRIMGSEAAVVSFAEFTCWNDEDFRYQRKPVTFRVSSAGTFLGKRFSFELDWDYGIWYHQHDEEVVRRLSLVKPDVDWGGLIYHRKWDSNWRIDICEPDEDRVVARVEVRQYRGTRLDVLRRDLGSNVVRLDDYRTSKLNGLACDETERLIADGS